MENQVQEQIVILCREPTRDVRCLEAELARRGRRVDVLRPAQIRLEVQGAEVLPRTEAGALTPAVVVGWTSGLESYWGIVLLKVFARLGCAVVNDGPTIDDMQSKVMNSVLLAAAGLPHVPTLICGRDTPAAQVVARLGLPVVLKPVMGAYGRGVRPLHTEQEVAAALREAAQSPYPLYFQAWVDKPGRDMRVQCADYIPVYGLYRYATQGAFVTNLSQGGRMDFDTPLPPQAYELAQRAAHAFNAPMAGVDIVEAPDGLRILEVNSVPAFQTMFSVAGKYADRLLPFCEKATTVFADIVEAALHRRSRDPATATATAAVAFDGA